MAIDTEFVLGYGGFVKINDIFVPYTNANIQRSNQVSFSNTYHVPFSNEPRSKIRMNEGLFTFSGSVSFELTEHILQEVLTKDFLSRTSMFDIVFHDGEKMIEMKKNMWNSISFSVQVNSIPTCSISFVSLNSYKEEIETTNGWSSFDLGYKDYPLQYWKSGSDDDDSLIQSFTVSFSRNVTSVFLNNKLKTPSYLRAGIIDCSLEVQCYDEWFDKASVNIGSKKITMLNEYSEEQSWSFAGNNQTGMKNRRIKGTNYSSEQVFTIT